jgi:transcriptional regulator with XRE-family HTH domain
MDIPEYGYTYGERLEHIREDHGLTIKAMAASVKVSPQTWRNYELDRTFPSMDTISALCGIYHVNEDWLSSGQGEMYLDGYRPGDPLGEPIDYKEKILQELQERKGMQNLSFQDILALSGKHSSREQMDIVLDSLQEARETMYDLEEELKSDAFSEACVCPVGAMECIRVVYGEKGWACPL